MMINPGLLSFLGVDPSVLIGNGVDDGEARLKKGDVKTEELVSSGAATPEKATLLNGLFGQVMNMEEPVNPGDSFGDYLADQGGFKGFMGGVVNEPILNNLFFGKDKDAYEQARSGYAFDKKKYDILLDIAKSHQTKLLDQQLADRAAQADRDRFATIDSEYIEALRTPDPSDDGQATANFLRNGGSRESANAIRQSLGMNPLNANDVTFKDFNTNYRKDTQAFADFQDQYTTLQDSLASDSGVGDLGLVFGLAKLFDPRSVVREGEVTTLQSTAGLPAQVMNMYKEVKEGRKLAPEQREQIQDYADRAYLNRLDKYDQVRERYIGRGTEGFGFSNLSTRLDDRALYRDQVDSIKERLSKAGVPKKQAEGLAEQMVDEAMKQFIGSQNPSDPTYIFPEAGNR